MAFISLEEALDRNPTFKPGWQPVYARNPDGNTFISGFTEPKFKGDIGFVAAVDDAGNPLYDKPIIAEKGLPTVGENAIRTGAVIVPYHINIECNLFVHVVSEYRDIVYNPLTKDFGVEMLGYPRGFVDDSSEDTILSGCRELKEETGLSPLNIVPAYATGSLGVVPNTGNTVNSTDVYFAQVGIERSEVTDKDILSSKFMLYRDFQNEIRNGLVQCGLTLAADSLFQTFLRGHHRDVYKRALNLE